MGRQHLERPLRELFAWWAIGIPFACSIVARRPDVFVSG